MSDSGKDKPRFALRELEGALLAQTELMRKACLIADFPPKRSISNADLARILRSPSIAAQASPHGIVRFNRLHGPGTETVDLDKCFRIEIGKRIDPRIPIHDPKTLVFYYGTPEGRWILGLGGSQQAAHGGDGYTEVHPLYVVHDLLLRGAPLPNELEKYRKFMTPDRNLPQAIAAWEESVSDAEHSNESPKSADCNHKALSQDDLTKTAWKLLRAMRRLGAISVEFARNRTDIAASAHSGNHDSDHNKTAFKQLLDLGLVVARRNVGTWLTEAGIRATDKRPKSG